MLSNLNHQNRTISLNQFPDVNQFIDPGLLKRREGWLPLRKSLATLLKIYMPKIIYDLSPRLLKRAYGLLVSLLQTGEKEKSRVLRITGHWL